MQRMFHYILWPKLTTLFEVGRPDPVGQVEEKRLKRQKERHPLE